MNAPDVKQRRENQQQYRPEGPLDKRCNRAAHAQHKRRETNRQFSGFEIVVNGLQPVAAARICGVALNRSGRPRAAIEIEPVAEIIADCE